MTNTMKLGELFAGYGGLGLAIEEVFSSQLAWVSEWEPAPSKVLAHRWPAAPNHGDITRIDWSAVEPVDIISGGSPCQDLSLAGKRRGMTDGTRSNLWESMREAIATIQPRYVVWENVRGALSAEATSEMEHTEGHLGDGRGANLRALGRVLGDLADLGFDAEWRGLRAADVGAPHGRFRLFILAAHRDGGRDGRGSAVPRHGQAPGADAPAYRADHRPGGTGPARPTIDAVTHTADDGLEERRTGGPAPEFDAAAGHRSVADFGPYAPAVARWESALGRRAPAPTETTGRNGKHRLSPAFTEWMMGLEPGHITDVPGVSWADQIKMCGNGVVPQQAAAALRDMLKGFS